MNNLKSLLGPMRVPFLILTPACALLGVGTAIWTTGHVNAVHVVLVLIGAVSAHISVNAFNEYFDFRSGLDLRTTRTPFSGGSGTLPEQPQMARAALITASIAFAVTGLIGLYFMSVRGLALLPLGLLGLFLILAYTVWLAYNPVLGLLAPGTGFGILMVMGTHVALTGQYSWTAFTASLVPFFLVNNLLLLNQFPDVQADQSVGRRHFPLIVGRRVSSYIYGAFLLLAYVAILAGVGLGQLPLASLIGLGTVVIAVPAFLGAVRYAEEVQKLVPYLGLNVIINIATPTLVGVGLLMR